MITWLGQLVIAYAIGYGAAAVFTGVKEFFTR